MEQDKRTGLVGFINTVKFIHYIAAKKVLQNTLGNEVCVTDEEVDRWLVDGEIKAREINHRNAIATNYRRLRYGSKVGPPMHDSRTFILIDELCSYYYSKDELEQFRPSTRWINIEQWIKRWMNFGYSRQEIEPLIKGCFRRVAEKDVAEPIVETSEAFFSPYYVCAFNIDPAWEWTWASPPIFSSSHILTCDVKTGDEVYFTGARLRGFGQVGSSRFAVADDGIYLLEDGDFLNVIAKEADNQYYIVDDQWYCKRRIQDSEEWVTEPCDSPINPLCNIVRIKLYSLEKIKRIEKEYFHEHTPSTAKDSAKNTIRAEADCESWLIALMKDKAQPDKVKAGYQAEAQSKFNGLSIRSFGRAWANAIKKTGSGDWSKPGRNRNPNTRFDTPK